MHRIVLLGPPGAGKGTQGTLLSERWGVPHVASGEILRRALADDKDTELARTAQTIKQGNFIPDAVANAVVFRELDRPEAAGGFVLDGYPRDVAQAEALEDYLRQKAWTLDAVVALLIEEQALVARLMGRLTCPRCGESYHVRSAPPLKEGVCDKCGAALVVRDDDQPERVRTRLALYHQKTEPLIAFYRERGLLRTVDGSGAEDTVFAAVRDAVEPDAPERDTVPGGGHSETLV